MSGGTPAGSIRTGGPTVTELFGAQVRRDPGAPALRFPDGELSYGELDELAESVAASLRDLGVGEGDVVGLAISPSAALITSLLAVLKLGAVYLPLAAENPPARNAFILEDSGARLVVRDAKAQGLFPDAVDFASLAVEHARGERAQGAGTDEQPAYIMYTSGSTGAPKGVVVPHRGIRRLVLGQNYCTLSPGDVIPLAANTAFDAATFEIWGALANGALLIDVPKETLLSAPDLERYIGANGVTVMHVTMAVFHLHARLSPAVFKNLDQLLTGGEAADPALVRNVLAAEHPRRMVHMYGPTECTTFATAQELGEDSARGVRVPIGHPIGETEVLVLDEDLRAADGLDAGEIYIGGPGVALGYHNRPDLTRERFVVLPGRAGRYFRTGDRGRVLANGAIEFLGRIDDQVKLQGMRIELGDVASAIRSSATVADCAVTVVGSEERRRLEAYVVFDSEVPDADALRRELERTLPDYMIPRRIHVCAELPLNANGKIDRARLAMDAR